MFLTTKTTVTKNSPHTYNTHKNDRNREVERRREKQFLANLGMKFRALVLDTSLVGKWRDDEGHGCCAAE